LNSTQNAVIALANMLPKAIYHVFMDNFFSSLDLFRSLHTYGHEATGIARPTSASIRSYRRISREKGGSRLVKTRYEFNRVKMILTPDN
jgi:hypothetical protein